MKYILKSKKQKAQISLEFIVFLAIFLLFFQSVIMPSMGFAENILKDIHNLTQTKQSVNFLTSNIESFSNSMGYGKRSMFFYLPSNAKISCSSSPNKINYQVIISNQAPVPSQCTNSICDFNKTIYIGNKSLTCDEIGPGYSGEITIEKNNIGDINVSFQ